MATRRGRGSLAAYNCRVEQLPASPSEASRAMSSLRAQLASTTDIATISRIVDGIEVLRVAARKAKVAHESQNDWATLKLEAQRAGGSALRAMRRNGELRVGRPNADSASALSQFGISQQQSSRWQRLAAISSADFDGWLQAIRSEGAEVTEIGALRFASQRQRGGGVGSAPANSASPEFARNVVITGDCLDVLRQFPEASVDALVTDPPAGINFMAAGWDRDRGGRAAWVGWMTEVMAECLRVLKPGAHGLVWSLPRTSHWTAWAMEDAGFEIRDAVIHIFAQGYPKSGNLKPAHETWWLGRKPMPGSRSENTGQHGTGSLNIEAARIPFSGDQDERESKGKNRHADWDSAPPENRVFGRDERSGIARGNYDPPGRWPANVVLTDAVLDDEHSPYVVGGGRTTARGHSPRVDNGRGMFSADGGGGGLAGVTRPGDAYFPTGGKSRYFQLPAESDEFPRYVVAAKASAKERFIACECEVPQSHEASPVCRTCGGVTERHIAQKPLALMRHLIRLVAPLGGVVLDPFAGTGTTGVACVAEGLHYVLIEQEPAYADFARARISAADSD